METDYNGLLYAQLQTLGALCANVEDYLYIHTLEMAVILPAVFILHDIILKGYKGDDLLKRIKTTHIWYWIVLLVFLVIYFVRFQNPNGGDEYFGGRFSLWLLNLPLIIIHDVGLLFTILPNIDHVIEPYGIKAVFAWAPLIFLFYG